MIIMIFVVLLTLVQNELQGCHLIREGDTPGPKQETIGQHIVRKK
jgi:hypothetical protein